MDQSETTPVIIASAFLLFIALAIAAELLLHLFKRKKHQAFLAKLAAAFAASMQGASWLVNVDGFSFTYALERYSWWSCRRYSKGRGSGIFLEITVACTRGASITLRRRRRTDGIWVPKSEELIESRNEDFDAHFIVVARQRKNAEVFFRSFENRQAVEKLFAAGFDLICCADGRLQAVKRMNGYGDIGRDLICSAAAQLQVLSLNMEGSIEGMDAAEKHKPLKRLLAGSCLFLLLGLSAFALYSYGTLDPLRLSGAGFFLGLGLTLLAFIVFLPALLRVRPGDEASARQDVLGLFISATFVFSFIASALILSINCYFDYSPPRIVTALVTAREAGQLSLFGVRQFGLRSWRDEEDIEIVGVSKEDWDDARPGVDCMTLFLRDGRFGYVWVQSQSLVSGSMDPACMSQQNGVLGGNGDSVGVVEEEKDEALNAEPELAPAVSAAMQFSAEETAMLDEDEDLKKKFDEYYKRLMDYILERWSWDDTSVDLHVSIEVQLSPKGVIKKIKTREKSGDSGFDNEALKALKKSSPLPAPPEELLPLFDELRISFHSQMGLAEKELNID